MKSSFYSFVFTLSLLIVGCSSDPDVPVLAGDPDPMDEMESESFEDAPDFSLKALDDTDISLADYKDKVLVIFFFGHNCPPCVAVGPTIEDELNQEFRTNEDFEIIGIDVWDGSNAQVQRFQETTTASFPLGLKGSSVSKDYNSGRDRLVVINKESKIVFNGTSVAKNDLSDVQNTVRGLLN